MVFKDLKQISRTWPVMSKPYPANLFFAMMTQASFNCIANSQAFAICRYLLNKIFALSDWEVVHVCANLKSKYLL